MSWWPPWPPSSSTRLSVLESRADSLECAYTLLSERINAVSASIAQELTDIRTDIGGLSTDLDAIKIRIDNFLANSHLNSDDQAALDAIRADVAAAKARADAMANPTPPAP